MSKRPKYDIGLASISEIVDDNTRVYNLQPWDKKLEEACQYHALGDELPEPFLPENM